MGQRFHPEIYRLSDERAKRNKDRDRSAAAENLRRVVARLRHVHVPVMLCVVRVRDSDADTATLLLRPILKRLGFLETLPNGDICLMCLSASIDREFLSDVSERAVTRVISRELGTYRRYGVKARCLLAFFHFWSDEFTEAPDLINVARLSHDGAIEINGITASAPPDDRSNSEPRGH